MYTALVIDEADRKMIIDSFDSVPEGFEVILHHMTICMGKCDDASLIGKRFPIKIVTFASNELVAAYGIETECPSKNERKHITIAVNREKGGKPVMSNKLELWMPTFIKFPIIYGTVEECQ